MRIADLGFRIEELKVSGVRDSGVREEKQKKNETCWSEAAAGNTEH